MRCVAVVVLYMSAHQVPSLNQSLLSGLLPVIDPPMVP